MGDTKNIQRTFIVSFDHAQGDIPVMCVGEPDENKAGIMNVIAMYQGQIAIDIYKKIVGEENEYNV